MNNVRIHPLTWLFGSAAAATGLFLEAICIGLILLIHELGHAGAAKAMGWRIQKVELLPFGGKLETDEHAGRPLLEEWLVVLAGPFMHVPMLAISFFFLKSGWMDAALYELFFELNAVIFLFNLLPVLPLDGGKMVQLILCAVHPYFIAYKQSIFLSFAVLLFVMGAAVITLPFYLQLLLTVSYIAVQLLVMWKEREVMFIRFLTARFYDPVSMRLLVLPLLKTDRLLDAVRLFRRNRTHQFHVNGHDELTEEQLLHSFFGGKKDVQDMFENID
ncbi:site-2 protease family protein [Domibacillus sp. A3M-37]|uniref:site-2 protease family protein n=1 Tax=Domibacillus sp. A3M-37 TaxID=2962037 RepID=UPI0020B78FB8|nr:site-2 protease family protein [Domibacillus sp. A3M-37]MCP3762595.1 site-2 protease family protein [Domibacillus sp. A3M-37]